MTKSELIELVELMRDRVRNARYHELIGEYENDDAIRKQVESADVGERVVVDR